MKRLICLVILVIGCDAETPNDDYRNYRQRTETARTDVCSQSTGKGQLSDLTGMWLIRALLNGGITLGLRIEILAADDEANMPPKNIEARFWLENNPIDMDIAGISAFNIPRESIRLPSTNAPIGALPSSPRL